VSRVPFHAAALAAALAALAACGPPPDRPPPQGLVDAETALADGRYGAAARGLRALRPADLDGAAVRLRAARAAVKVREFERAAAFLEADTVREPGRAPEAGILRAEALVRCGRNEDAKKLLADLEIAGARTERWRYVYALLARARGEHDLATRDLEAMAAAGSRDPDVLVRWAELPLPNGFAEAKARLDEAVKRAADPAAVLAMRGRLLLRPGGEPRAALEDLEAALVSRPWDREARRDRVRARVAVGGSASVERACAEAEAMVAEDPDDMETRLALAEALGEAGRLAGLVTDGAINLPPATVRFYGRAAEQYAEFLRRPGRDPVAMVRALHGLARVEIQLIPLDETGRQRIPGSHFAKAMALLQRAEEADPDGRLRGDWDLRLLGETHYLRGRACKRVHEGTSDNTDALRWYEKAVGVEGRHIEATWDLGHIYYDFFPDTPAYWQKAVDTFRLHLMERERRGLGPLDEVRMGIVKSANERLAKGKRE
jgi:tetratricopeptide (TPR) repeat protein